MTHASLFSGIGGFDLAARNCGIQNVFQVEINEFCQRVLEKNIYLETFSLVLVGETTLTPKTLENVVSSIKKIQSRQIKHFAIHLEGLLINYLFYIKFS